LLSDEERRRRALLLRMSDILMVLDADGRLDYVSPSTNRILGYPTDSYVGQDLLDLVPPEHRVATGAALGVITAEPGRRGLLDMRLLAADGAYRDYEGLADNLVKDPDVAGVLIVVRDVEERNRIQEAHRSQADVLELIASEAPLHDVLQALVVSVEGQLEDKICTVLLTELTDGRLVFRHGASPGMPGLYRDALEGRQITDHPSPCGQAIRSSTAVLVPDIFADTRFTAMRGLAQVCEVRSCWSFPVVSPTSGDVLGTFALYGRSPGLPDAHTERVLARASRLVAIALDHQTLLARLEHQAHHDDLTGLPNRMALLKRLTDGLRRCNGDEPGPAVIFLDLDRLKIVNDSLGHDVGDELLVSIAERLSAALPPDAMVARFGGDEFVVLVDRPGDAARTEAMARQVLAAVADPVRLAGRLITPSASAGVVVAAPGQSATEMLRDADIAMYRAKHRGGARIAVFTEDMRQRAFDRLDLEGEIRHGLANDEFRVFFQPVIDLPAGNALVGFEALVRWQHPQRGLLAPGAFIDLAEETGLIVDLGEWVLRTVAATVHGWSVEVPQLRGTVAVNLAAKQLDAPGFVSVVRTAMGEMGDWSLCLEFTESALMGDSSASRVIIDELAGLGASLAIDDFGTGFSSLSYLTRLPVSTLKIDQSFVHDLDKPAGVAVAAAVLNLATGLGLSVIAEGIETEAQRAALLALGCRLGQGFLLGRPMPEDEARSFLLAAAAVLQVRG
jgi:diguanylate cyclase (GGDEF)-like protein/PAS domain S-box-containing protein